MVTSVLVARMTKAEARSALDAVVSEVQAGVSAMERATALIAEIEIREGYRALGYRSLAACLAAELQVTRQRAYAVLEEMHGRMLLTEAAPEIKVTSREARAVAKQPAIAAQVREAVVAGVEPSSAYQRALAEQRAQGPIAKPSPSHRGQTTIIDRLRSISEALDDIADQLDDSPVDPDFARAVDRLENSCRRITARAGALTR